MEIPTMKQHVSPQFVPTFKRPISTTKVEALEFKAKKAAYKRSKQAGTIGIIGTAIKGVFQITQSILEAQEATDIMNAKKILTEKQKELSSSFTDPENPVPWEEWEEITESKIEEWHEEILSGMKLERSKKTFEEGWPNYREGVLFEVGEAVKQRQILEMRAIYEDSFNTAVEDDNLTQALEAVVGAKASYLITPGKALEDERYARETIAYSIARKAVYGVGLEEGLKLINSPEMNSILAKAGLKPEDLTDQAKATLFEDLKSYHKSIQAEQAQELERVRTQVQSEIVKVYSEGNVKELRQLRDQILALKILPPVGDHSQKFWIDQIDKKIKTYLDAKSKGETDPNTQFDPDIYAKMLQVAYDDSIDLATKEEIIMSNMGADAQGNPRLRAKEDIPTLINLARAEKSFTVKMAFKSFDLALANEIITPIQYIDIATAFHKAVESGKYTEDGLRQEAENLLIKANEEYIKPKLDKPGPFKRREKPEEYIERHPPEKIPIKKGLAAEFEEFFNKKPVDTYIDEYGREAIFDGENWYIKIDGVWHKSNPETNTYEPYRRKR